MKRAVSDADKAQRRTAILDAARQVFSEKGFHEAAIADVARAADVSYGSIYWYFDSKEALFLSLMDAQEQLLRERIEQVRAELDGANDMAAFSASIRVTLEFFEENRDATRLLFRDANVLSDGFGRNLADINERFIGLIESHVVDAQRLGLLRPWPSRLVAFSVAALISEVALRRLDTDDGIDAATAAEFIASMLLEGLIPR